MMVQFDHVNVRTTNLEAMIAWYTDILGMQSGKRPDFPFPGAWMYLGDQALVHLVGVDATAEPDNVQLEHFALRAKGLDAFCGMLKDRDLDYYLADVPGFGITQVNIHDPDGNHIHIDFHATDEA